MEAYIGIGFNSEVMQTLLLCFHSNTIECGRITEKRAKEYHCDKTIIMDIGGNMIEYIDRLRLWLTGNGLSEDEANYTIICIGKVMMDLLQERNL